MNVQAAADAAGLERLLRERPTRILLLDIDMPGEDGLGGCEHAGSGRGSSC
jgi:DNA-binding response OmpR family regulator